jgi:hypothetical protein
MPVAELEMKNSSVKKFDTNKAKIQISPPNVPHNLSFNTTGVIMSLKSLPLLMCLFSLPVFAGAESGGGGDVIVFQDDSVVLADPWIDNNSPQPSNMPALRSLNPRILKTIQSYISATESTITELAGESPRDPLEESLIARGYLPKDFPSSNKMSDISALISELGKRSNGLRFYGVKNALELNDFCASGGKKVYKLPNGAQVQQVACTAGVETFIIEPLFERLSIRQQALLLIHERLTTLRDSLGGKNYSAIARFTTGLNVYVNLYKEQVKNKFRPLLEVEQKQLSEFYIAIEELELRNSEVTDDSFQWSAHPIGGGRVHTSASIDPSAVIALDSVIYKGSEIAAGARVQKLMNRNKLPMTLKKDSNVENVLIYSKEKDFIFSVAEKSIIKNSNLLFSRLVVGENSKIMDTNIKATEITIGNEVEFSNSQISIEKKIQVADGQKLVNQSLLDETVDKFYPEGVTLRPIDVTLSGIDFTSSTHQDLGEKVISILNNNGEGIVVTRNVAFLGRCEWRGELKIFGEYKKYQYSNIRAKVVFKNFVKNTDTSLMVITSDGLIKAAGFQKRLEVEGRIPDRLLESLMTNGIEIKRFVDTVAIMAQPM